MSLTVIIPILCILLIGYIVVLYNRLAKPERSKPRLFNPFDAHTPIKESPAHSKLSNNPNHGTIPGMLTSIPASGYHHYSNYIIIANYDFNYEPAIEISPTDPTTAATSSVFLKELTFGAILDIMGRDLIWKN